MSERERDWLARRFEQDRGRLRSVAYRMLGSQSEAEDAVQETWLRLSRSDADAIENLGGWLTTVVARISLDMLRARRTRAEESVAPSDSDAGSGADDVVDSNQRHAVFDVVAIDNLTQPSPERDALMADSISLALLVVLETLSPAERLAFVLHDMFDVSFDEIASIMGKAPTAVRQLASRARRRVQGTPTRPDADIAAEREVVEAFLSAARRDDFSALMRILDPDVVVRADYGTSTSTYRGAETAAKGAITGARLTAFARFVLVNGVPGFVSFTESGEPRSMVSFTVVGGRITEVDVIADPDRLRRLDLPRPKP